jgi:hypothetical protein
MAACNVAASNKAAWPPHMKSSLANSALKMFGGFNALSMPSVQLFSRSKKATLLRRTIVGRSSNTVPRGTFTLASIAAHASITTP